MTHKSASSPRKLGKHLLVLYVVLATAIGGMALATDTQPNVIKTLVSRGIQVEKSFPATSGLLGWLLTNGGEYSIVFTTADGKTLVSGDLFNERGENLTALYAEKYIPKPDYSDAYGELEKSAYIPEGELTNPKNIVYVVFDPNCPFCHLIWTALQPYQQQGLQVRWVPVAYLRESSGPKGAAMLTAKDKTEALGKIMQGFGKNEAEFSKLKVDAKTQKILDHNSTLMRTFRFSGTPGVVWKDKQGKVLTKHGMPRLSELPQITGMPEQPQTDPRLARFR